MPTRLAAQKALQRLWNINPDLSEDDEIGIDHDGEPLMVASDIAQVESDSQSDSDVNEDQALEMVGKDQTIWKNVNNNSQLRGRMPSDNVFIVTPGVKPSAKRMIDSPESAWRLHYHREHYEKNRKTHGEYSDYDEHQWKQYGPMNSDVPI